MQQLQDFTYVKLGGTIDEDNDLGPLAGHIRGKTVIVDLGRITEINNCGVRDWVRWLEDVQQKSQVVLVECSPAIVAQLNLVSNFAGNGYIKSFYVPYFCQACNSEKAMLVDMDELPPDTFTSPTCRCDACDAIMAFDDLEESYFRFIKDARRTIPSESQALLDQVAPGIGERKIVSGAETSSSFVGLPSTTRSHHNDFTAIATGSSVAALRRLREKTGLRTHRNVPEDEAPRPDGVRRWVVVAAATALLVGVAFVGALFLL